MYTKFFVSKVKTKLQVMVVTISKVSYYCFIHFIALASLSPVHCVTMSCVIFFYRKHPFSFYSLKHKTFAGNLIAKKKRYVPPTMLRI